MHMASDLLIECVNELLSCGGSGKSGSVKQRATKSAEIEMPFSGPVERYPHPVHQVNDGWSLVAHVAHQGLVGEKVATLDRVIKMFFRGIAFVFCINGGVDASLRANRMGSL